MKPTTQTPTEAGWYLWRDPEEFFEWDATEVWPEDDELCVTAEGNTLPVAEVGGEWLGPFTLDEVAGWLETRDVVNVLAGLLAKRAQCPRFMVGSGWRPDPGEASPQRCQGCEDSGEHEVHTPAKRAACWVDWAAERSGDG